MGGSSWNDLFGCLIGGRVFQPRIERFHEILSRKPLASGANFATQGVHEIAGLKTAVVIPIQLGEELLVCIGILFGRRE
jgi:hypothetical protein